MKTGKFLYRCRLCGEVFDSGLRTSFIRTRTDFFALMDYGEAITKNAQVPRLHENHYCEENNDFKIGLGDLVGCVEDVEP